MLSGAGGGPVVVNSSTATLNDLTVTNGSGGIVGGIYNTGTLTITKNSTIANNSGSQSGGIYNGTSTLYPTITITDSTISGNTGAAAGGIYNYGVFDVTITDDTISGNVATGLLRAPVVVPSTTTGTATASRSPQAPSQGMPD